MKIKKYYLKTKKSTLNLREFSTPPPPPNYVLVIFPTLPDYSNPLPLGTKEYCQKKIVWNVVRID